MSITEKFKRFWNDTLGVDCPDEADISKNEELRRSMETVRAIEEQYGESNSGKETREPIVPRAEADNEMALMKAKSKKPQSQLENQKEIGD